MKASTSARRTRLCVPSLTYGSRPRAQRSTTCCREERSMIAASPMLRSSEVRIATPECSRGDPCDATTERTLILSERQPGHGREQVSVLTQQLLGHRDPG